MKLTVRVTRREFDALWAETNAANDNARSQTQALLEDVLDSPLSAVVMAEYRARIALCDKAAQLLVELRAGVELGTMRIAQCVSLVKRLKPVATHRLTDTQQRQLPTFQALYCEVKAEWSTYRAEGRDASRAEYADGACALLSSTEHAVRQRQITPAEGMLLLEGLRVKEMILMHNAADGPRTP